MSFVNFTALGRDCSPDEFAEILHGYLHEINNKIQVANTGEYGVGTHTSLMCARGEVLSPLQEAIGKLSPAERAILREAVVIHVAGEKGLVRSLKDEAGLPNGFTLPDYPELVFYYISHEGKAIIDLWWVELYYTDRYAVDRWFATEKDCNDFLSKYRPFCYGDFGLFQHACKCKHIINKDAVQQYHAIMPKTIPMYDGELKKDRW